MSHPYEKPSDSSQQSRKSSRSLREVRRQRTSAQLQTPGGQSSSLTQEQSFATPTAPQATILGVSAQSTTTSTITGSPVHGRILSQQPPVNPTTPSRVAPGVSARSTTTSTTTTEPLSRTARILTQEQPPATFTTQAATETIAGVSAQFRTSTTTTESLPRCESSLTQTEPPATPTTPPEAPSTSTWPATTLAQNESCQKHPYLVKLLCSPTKKQLSNIRKPTDPVNERNPQPISGTPQTIIGPSTQGLPTNPRQTSDRFAQGPVQFKVPQSLPPKRSPVKLQSCSSSIPARKVATPLSDIDALPGPGDQWAEFRRSMGIEPEPGSPSLDRGTTRAAERLQESREEPPIKLSRVTEQPSTSSSSSEEPLVVQSEGPVEGNDESSSKPSGDESVQQDSTSSEQPAAISSLSQTGVLTQREDESPEPVTSPLSMILATPDEQFRSPLSDFNLGEDEPPIFSNYANELDDVLVTESEQILFSPLQPELSPAHLQGSDDSVPKPVLKPVSSVLPNATAQSARKPAGKPIRRPAGKPPRTLTTQLPQNDSDQERNRTPSESELLQQPPAEVARTSSSTVASGASPLSMILASPDEQFRSSPSDFISGEGEPLVFSDCGNDLPLDEILTESEMPIFSHSQHEFLPAHPRGSEDNVPKPVLKSVASVLPYATAQSARRPAGKPPAKPTRKPAGKPPRTQTTQLPQNDSDQERNRTPSGLELLQQPPAEVARTSSDRRPSPYRPSQEYVATSSSSPSQEEIGNRLETLDIADHNPTLLQFGKFVHTSVLPYLGQNLDSEPIQSPPSDTVSLPENIPSVGCLTDSPPSSHRIEDNTSAESPIGEILPLQQVENVESHSYPPDNIARSEENTSAGSTIREYLQLQQVQNVESHFHSVDNTARSEENTLAGSTIRENLQLQQVANVESHFHSLDNTARSEENTLAGPTIRENLQLQQVENVESHSHSLDNVARSEEDIPETDPILKNLLRKPPGQMAAVTAPGDPQGNPQENPQGNLQRHPQTNQQESRQQNQHENRQRHQQENRQRNQQGNSQENQQRNRQRNSQGNSQRSSQRNVEGNSQANSQGPLTHLNPVLRHPPQPGAPPRLEQMGPPPVPVLEAGGWKVLLPNGHRMPVIGLGVYKPPDPIQVEQAVRFAIQVGYRHFDCAWIQGIEEDVGRAINRAIEDNLVTREELFITTKVWNNFHRRDKVATMLEQSLQTMRLDYVDLYLIHWPMAFHIEGELIPILQEDYCLEGEKLPYDTCDYLETWQGMEDCVQNGTAKSIGVANFNSKQLARLLMNASIKPVVNQIEVNPWFNNARLIDYCRSVNVLVQCYSPLGLNEIGSPDGKREPTLIHSYLEQIGKQYYTRTEVDGKVEVIYKTPTQVVLNWLVKNKNLVVVPKSVTELKIYEYLGIFDFDLNPAHVRYLDLLNIDDRMWKARAFANHPHYPFHEPF